MNILICSEFFSPSIGGAQKVCEELALNFSKSGNKVTVVTSKHLTKLKSKENFKNKIKIIRYSITGNLVKGIKGETKKYQKFLLNNKFDAILFYAAQQWTFDAALEIIDKIDANIYFAPCGFSKLNNLLYRKYFETLPKFLKKFKKNILHSNDYRDSIFFKQHNIKNKILIPNGSDLNYKNKKFNLNNNKNNTFKILSVSNYKFAKGQDLSIFVFFLLNIASRVELLLVGNEIKSKIYKSYLYFLKFITELVFKNKKIIFYDGSKRSRVKYFFETSDIFLFTSRIECSPLVLFESASAGLPFFSLNVGNSKEISKWTGCGFVYENISLLSNGIEKLINNKKKLKKLSINGKESSKRTYNWKKISKKYLDLFKTYKSV